MSSLPDHGPIDCRRCWTGCASTETTLDDGRFELVNNPAAWGSSTPRIAVLGQTKGMTQTRNLAAMRSEKDFVRAPFDASADGGTLLRILQSVGLAEGLTSLEQILARNDDWHFGSLIRCSLFGRGRASESGKVGPAYRAPEAGRVVRTCFETWLSDLPERLRLVVLLGNADNHMKAVRRELARIHPNLATHPAVADEPEAPCRQVAFTAGGAIWVHVAHFSGANRGASAPFIAGDASVMAGRKGLAARRAIASIDWSAAAAA